MSEGNNNQGGWLYNKIVRDHFFHPRNYLETDSYEADGLGTSGSQVCGDLMKVWIKVDSSTNKIIDCKWQTFGCASAIASTSMMSVIVLENGGMDLEMAKKITAKDILDRLGGLPDNKIHCSVLGHLALGEAISDFLQKRKNLSSGLGQEEYFYLKNKKEEAREVLTLEFVPENGKVFDYKSGQFAVFKIINKNKPNILTRAYTITSLSGDESLSITVKRAGAFSNALCDLAAGDRVKITGPYGNFYPIETCENDFVFLAGGIGVTPFLSFIKDLRRKESSKKIFLFCSNKNSEDIIFRKELDEISKKWGNLKVIYTLTRAKEKGSLTDEYKRIDLEMIKKYVGDLDKKEYFICGPSTFVFGIKEQLENAGVNRIFIKTEAFY
jgi:ferredoxin-NADP reductase/NifU-like protein involved in Fe-S cluster formation